MAMSSSLSGEWKNTRAALSKLEAELQCKLCTKLVVDPHSISQCNHFFCKLCITGEKYSECPVCKIPIFCKNIQKQRQLESLLQCYEELRDLLKLPLPEKSTEAEQVADIPHAVDKALEEVTIAQRGTATPHVVDLQLNTGILSSTTVKGIPNRRNLKGETPLHSAAIQGRYEDVFNLLRQGHNINAKDYAGWTPLHEASNYGYEEIAEFLLVNGANVNVTGFNNITPLQDAVLNNHLETVKILMSYGADTSMRDINGFTALQMATTDEMKDILRTEIPQDATVEKVKVEDDRNFVFFGSTLNAKQQRKMSACAKLLNGSIASTFSDDVTHLIIPSTKLSCRRTFKFMMSVLKGKWILSYEWIEKCVEKNTQIDEEEYEIQGTTHHPRSFGPKRSRTNFCLQRPGLFSGCEFYFQGIFAFPSLLKEDLISLVTAGDGIVLTREPKLDYNFQPKTVPFHAEAGHPLLNCAQYIIYNSGTSPAIAYNSKHLKSFPSLWLLECISKFQLVPPPPTFVNLVE